MVYPLVRNSPTGLVYIEEETPLIPTGSKYGWDRLTEPGLGIVIGEEEGNRARVSAVHYSERRLRAAQGIVFSVRTDSGIKVVWRIA